LANVSGITTQAHRFNLSAAEVDSAARRRRKFVQQLRFCQITFLASHSHVTATDGHFSAQNNRCSVY